MSPHLWKHDILLIEYLFNGIPDKLMHGVLGMLVS